MAAKKPTMTISTKDQAAALVSEYESLRRQDIAIKERKDLLADTLKEYAKTYGTKDDKGSFIVDTPSHTFGAVARKSVKLDADKALDFVRERGWDECVVNVPTIDEDALEKRLRDGDLSMDEMESLTTTKTTYAIDVTAKEEMPEVQQTAVQTATAAKRKPPVLKRKG